MLCLLYLLFGSGVGSAAAILLAAASSPCTKTLCSQPGSQCTLSAPVPSVCQSLAGQHATRHNSDWTLEDGEEVSGLHCAVHRFVVPAGVTAFVKAWNGKDGGSFLVEATKDVTIAGTLSATGKGYRGGQRGEKPDQNGQQGEGMNGAGSESNLPNGGGGGGGRGGEAVRSQRLSIAFNAGPGGGGGHGTQGEPGHIQRDAVGGNFTSVNGVGEGGK